MRKRCTEKKAEKSNKTNELTTHNIHTNSQKYQYV